MTYHSIMLRYLLNNYLKFAQCYTTFAKFACNGVLGFGTVCYIRKTAYGGNLGLHFSLSLL